MPSEAFGSFGSSVILRGLVPLPPSWPILPPEPLKTLWTSCRPQEALGAFGNLTPHPCSLPGSWDLGKPWEPLETISCLGASVRLRGLVFLAPPNSHFSFPPTYMALHIQHHIYSAAFTVPLIWCHLCSAIYTMSLIWHHVYSTRGVKGANEPPGESFTA